jgi:hypothetical protein
MVRTRVGSGPPPGLDYGPGTPSPRILGLVVSDLDPSRRSRLCIQGPGTFPWGSRPSVDTMEYIVFSGRVVTWESTTWWGRALFTTGLEVAAWAPRLHTIVRGTPVLGYRQWPRGPLHGRMRACRWGQNLYFASTWHEW